MQVTLFIRANCPKCQRAIDALEPYKLSPQLVDIDGDQELVAKYDCCVPVVTVDGKIRFRGEVNEILLRRLLTQAEQKPQ